MKHRVVILITWFGKWPFWMDFFMESCKWNKSIHWKIVTDCGNAIHPAENVELIHRSFDDFCAGISEVLNIHFYPEGAYKLCDIKPALGCLLENYIQDYTFWGFGDLDVIYGDLGDYYTDELLDKYDLVSSHARRISGHLCLIRNTHSMRNVFRRIPKWRQILEDPRHRTFDEKHFSKLFLRNKNWPCFIRRAVDQFYPLRRKALFREIYSTPNAGINWIDNTCNFPSTWFWEKGKLTNDRDGGRLFPYFHFMNWKKEWSNRSIDALEFCAMESFQINEQGFSVCKK